MASFRALHQSGNPLVMINVWDAGTAKLMMARGARALATSSAALAYTLGRPDGGTVTRDEALAHAQDIVAATDLPVQGDFENGFGDSPETCAETVRLAAEAGLAGICIEDIGFPSGTPYPRDLATERMAAAASAARGLGKDFMLTARADGVMTGGYDMAEALTRVAAFDAAGVDCLYVPMPPDMQALGQIVASTDKPVNALAAGPFAHYRQHDFAALGVARISIGSALARATQRLILDAGNAMLTEGEFAALTHVAGSNEVDPHLG